MIANSMWFDGFVELSGRRCVLVEGEGKTDETWEVLLLFALACSVNLA